MRARPEAAGVPPRWPLAGRARRRGGCGAAVRGLHLCRHTCSRVQCQCRCSARDISRRTGVPSPAAQVQAFMFGSVPLKTYLPDGDIDMAVFQSHGPSVRDSWTTKLGAVLEAEARSQSTRFRVKDVQVIHAEVRGTPLALLHGRTLAGLQLHAASSLEAPELVQQKGSPKRKRWTDSSLPGDRSGLQAERPPKGSACQSCMSEVWRCAGFGCEGLATYCRSCLVRGLRRPLAPHAGLLDASACCTRVVRAPSSLSGRHIFMSGIIDLTKVGRCVCTVACTCLYCISSALAADTPRRAYYDERL